MSDNEWHAEAWSDQQSIHPDNTMEEGSTMGVELPMFPGFIPRMLPLILGIWVLALVLTFSIPLLSTGVWGGVLLVLAAWATPTLMMLWPVARREGQAYTAYRRSAFLLSVLSMAGVPLAVGIVILAPPADATLRIGAVVALLTLVIGFGGIPAAIQRAQGRPVRMFFRPDLVLGTNRILAGGLVAVAIGMKFIFTDAPPGDVPHGNWYAFAFLIVLGLYQLIPIRGMIKVKTRMLRMTKGRTRGFLATAAKESYLLAILTLMLFFAHNFFGGVVPFTMNVLKGSVFGVELMLVSGGILVVVRSAYKMRIGDPFFRETFQQSLLKDLLLLVGVTVYLYGYLNVMLGHVTINSGSAAYLTWIGLGLYAWGALFLLPVRAWARTREQQGILDQMVCVVLPSLPGPSRDRTVDSLLRSLVRMPRVQAERAMGMMKGALSRAPKKAQDEVVSSQLRALVNLPGPDRARILQMMDAAPA